MTVTERRRRGKVPDYWWDFNLAVTEIKVETDDPRVPSGIVRSFHLTDNGDASLQIQAAEQLIAQLKSGRATSA